MEFVMVTLTLTLGGIPIFAEMDRLTFPLLVWFTYDCVPLYVSIGCLFPHSLSCCLHHGELSFHATLQGQSKPSANQHSRSAVFLQFPAEGEQEGKERGKTSLPRSLCPLL